MTSVARAFVLVAALVAAAVSPASAEDYPSRSIRLVVPYPAGGPNDILARMIGQKLAVSLGKPVVVDNKPGASTMLGNDLVAKAPPDGYTLLLNNSTLATTTVLYKKVPYRLDDFVAVAPVADTGLVLTVPGSSPVQSLAELVAAAKANPGTLNYASAGRGGATHLTSEEFKRVAGIQAVGVEYRGSAPLIGDLIAGAVQFYFYPVTGSLGYIRTGQIRALAVTSAERLAAAPDIPVFKELGYPAMRAPLLTAYSRRRLCRARSSTGSTAKSPPPSRRKMCIRASWRRAVPPSPHRLRILRPSTVTIFASGRASSTL